MDEPYDAGRLTDAAAMGTHTADETLSALVENHRRFLAFVERRVGTRTDAEDIVQSAFVRGWERSGDLRDDEKVVAWFYRLLRNSIIDHWRTRASRERAVEAYGRELDDPSPSPQIETELCACFEPLLGTLKPEYSEILRRVDLEDSRPVDFAREAGISANNAMVRLHRARSALRRRLEESCRTCAEHGCLDCTCSPPEGAAAGASGGCH